MRVYINLVAHEGHRHAVRWWRSDSDDGGDDALPVHKSLRHRVRRDALQRARSLCRLRCGRTFTSN